MHFIIGLGNPGLKYDSTRHNVGFEVIERFAHDNSINVNKKEHKGITGQGVIKGKKVVLVKPQTYMNLSGECVRSILDYYNCTSKDIIVVYDDINLKLGDIKIREKGSAGGHNGIKNIISHLGTNEFIRVRVGVGEKPPYMDLANYVLGGFSKDELPTIIDSIETASAAVETVIDKGLIKAMNVYNVKKKDL